MNAPEYLPRIWDYLDKPETRRFQDIEVFKTELQKLITNQRDQFPRGGELLILENRIKIYGPRIDMNQRKELGEILKSAAFDDIGNVDWGMKRLDAQLNWWRVKLGFDVVAIPGYIEKHIFDEYFYGYYRFFNRPTYLEINKKK
jgi:hypothetical protein